MQIVLKRVGIAILVAGTLLMQGYAAEGPAGASFETGYATLAQITSAEETRSDGVRTIQRPLLMFGPEDIPSLRAKIQSEPHKTLYGQFKDKLDTGGGWNSFVDMQVAALAYLGTGEQAYARTAARLLLDHQLRPLWERLPTYQGKDYVSLTVSRNVQIYCTVFDIVEPSGVFDSEDLDFVEKVLTLAASRLMEREKQFNPYDYYSDRFLPDNWNTDRYAAVGMVALTFPNHPYSVRWLNHSIEQFAWQMDNAVLPDGAWPEGTRYLGAVLRALIPFAYALERNTHWNLFESERFKKMIEYPMRVQTPPDKVLGGIRLTPGANSANWENIWECTLGWAAKAYRDSDPFFAGKLMGCWEAAGKPYVVEWSPANQLGGFLWIDPDIEPITPQSIGSEILPSGYAVLRGQHNDQTESYFLMSVDTRRLDWQWNHPDRGGLSLYAYNTPIALDPGVKDYDSTMHEWYMTSRAHNLVVPYGKVMDGNGEFGTCIVDEGFDFVEADLSEAAEMPYHRRVFFVKPAQWLIWDQVDSAEPATCHFHVLAEDQKIPTMQNGGGVSMDRVLFDCQNDVSLEVGILSPADGLGRGLMTLQRDLYPVFFHTESGGAPQVAYEKTQQWLRIRRPAQKEDFLMMLYAMNPNSPSLVYEQGDADSAVRSFVFSCGSQESRFCLGDSATLQETESTSFQGTAAVWIVDESSSREVLYLIDTIRYEDSRGFGIESEQQAVISLQSLKKGVAYRLRNFLNRKCVLTIALPWETQPERVEIAYEQGDRAEADLLDENFEVAVPAKKSVVIGAGLRGLGFILIK